MQRSYPAVTKVTAINLVFVPFNNEFQTNNQINF